MSTAAAREIAQLMEDVRELEAEVERLRAENEKMRELLKTIAKAVYEIK
jgi:uncharacterized membrane protein